MSLFGEILLLVLLVCVVAGLDDIAEAIKRRKP